MDQLVSGDWLEKELGAPDLRVLDCSVVMEVDRDGRRSYRPGGADWEQSHIPGSAHVDLFTQISERVPGLPECGGCCGPSASMMLRCSTGVAVVDEGRTADDQSRAGNVFVTQNRR